MYSRLVIFVAVVSCVVIAVNADPFKKKYDSCKSNINTLLDKPAGKTKCNLVSGLSSLSVNASLTTAENTTFQAWITNMETTIINNASITGNQSKLDMCAAEFMKFQMTNATIWSKIQYLNISTTFGGSCDTFVRITNEYNFASSMELITATDMNGNCKLFDALLAACSGDAAKTAAFKAFIESDLKVIVKNKGKKSQPDIMKAIKKAMKEKFFVGGQASWMNDFYGYKLKGYSFSFSQFIEVTTTYEKKDSLNATLAGQNMTCPFILALNASLSNTNYTVTQRGFFKQLLTYFQQQFSTITDTQGRMDCISSKFSESCELSPGYFSLIGGLSISSFGGGSFFDLIIIGGCQVNTMPMTCGCPMPYANMNDTMTTEMPWETSTKCSCSCEL